MIEAAPGHRGGQGGGHPWLTSPLRDWQGQGREPSATLHIIPDFRESKGDARPCLSCTPSPGALKPPPPPPLSWILRLCPGAGSHPLAPTRGRREESCSSRSCCSDTGWAQSGSGEALTCFNPLSRLLSSRLLILKREKEAVPGER